MGSEAKGRERGTGPAAGSGRSRRSGERPAGFTLVELVVVLVIAGVLMAAGLQGYRSWEASAKLDGAAHAVRGQLGRARLLAVARRQTIRIRLTAGGALTLLDPSSRVLGSTPLGRGGPFGLDSVRIRPAWFRYNGRGQAAPGSIYLYRGDRGVRLVSNFLGRIRRENFSVPDG